MLAVQQGMAQAPPPPPNIPVMVQTLDTPESAAARAQRLAEQAAVSAPFFRTPAEYPGPEAYAGGWTFAPRSPDIWRMAPAAGDPLGSIAGDILPAQPPAEAPAVKETLAQVYHDVVDELHNHEKMAEVLAEALVSKAVEEAIDKAPEFAACVLVAIGRKKRKKKEATASLDTVAEDLDRINELYATGVPVTVDEIQRRLGISSDRARAALRAGLYTGRVVVEWHPAGVSAIR